jgi:hypothetical protein
MQIPILSQERSEAKSESTDERKEDVSKEEYSSLDTSSFLSSVDSLFASLLSCDRMGICILV